MNFSAVDSHRVGLGSRHGKSAQAVPASSYADLQIHCLEQVRRGVNAALGHHALAVRPKYTVGAAPL
jgi:hypothetical protein